MPSIGGIGSAQGAEPSRVLGSIQLQDDNTGIIASLGTGTSTQALRTTLATDVGLPAGTALLGKAGIDQTTPGTTNGVTIAPTSAAAAGIAPVVSTALETGHVIKASPGNLYGLEVMSTSAGGMVLVFDSTTVPAAGAVTPKKAYSLPANSTLVVGFDPPLLCAVGISVAFSIAVTPFTKTDSATAFISGDAV